MEAVVINTSNAISNCQRQYQNLCTEVNQLIQKIDKGHKINIGVDTGTEELGQTIDKLNTLVESKFPALDRNHLKKLHEHCAFITGMLQLISSGAHQRTDEHGTIHFLDKRSNCSYELEIHSFQENLNDCHAVLRNISNEVAKEKTQEVAIYEPKNTITPTQTTPHEENITKHEEAQGVDNPSFFNKTKSLITKAFNNVVAGLAVAKVLLAVGLNKVIDFAFDTIIKAKNTFQSITKVGIKNWATVAFDLTIISIASYIASITNSNVLRNICYGQIIYRIAKYLFKLLKRSGQNPEFAFDPSGFEKSRLNLGIETRRKLSQQSMIVMQKSCTFDISSAWLKNSLWVMKPFLFIKNAPIALDKFLSSNNRDDLTDAFFRKELIYTAATNVYLYRRLQSVLDITPPYEDITNVVILPVASNKEYLLPLPAGGIVKSINFLDQENNPIGSVSGKHEITRCILGGFTVVAPPNSKKVIYIIDEQREDLSQYQPALAELKALLPTASKEPVCSVFTRNLLEKYFSKDASVPTPEELLLLFKQLKLHYIESNSLVSFYETHNNRLAGAVTDLRVGVCDTFTFLLDHYTHQHPDLLGIRQAGYVFVGESLDFATAHAVNGIVALEGTACYSEVDLTTLATEKKINFRQSLALLFNLYANRSASFREQVVSTRKVLGISSDQLGIVSTQSSESPMFDEFLPKLLSSTMDTIREISGQLNIKPYDKDLFEQLVEALDLLGIGANDWGGVYQSFARNAKQEELTNLTSDLRTLTPQIFIIEHTWQHLSIEQKQRIIAHQPTRAIFSLRYGNEISDEINSLFMQKILAFSSQDLLEALPHILKNLVNIRYGSYNPELSEAKVPEDYNFEKMPTNLLEKIRNILVYEPTVFVNPEKIGHVIDYYFALEVHDLKNTPSSAGLDKRRELVYEIIDLLIKQPKFTDTLVKQLITDLKNQHAQTYIYLIAERNLVTSEQVVELLNSVHPALLGRFGTMCYSLSFNNLPISSESREIAIKKLTKIARREISKKLPHTSDLLWGNSESLELKQICDFFGFKPSGVSTLVPIRASLDSHDRRWGVYELVSNPRRILLRNTNSTHVIDISNYPKLLAYLIKHDTIYEQHSPINEIGHYASKLFATSDSENPDDSKLLYDISKVALRLEHVADDLRAKLFCQILDPLNLEERYQAILAYHALQQERINSESILNTGAWIIHPSFSSKAKQIALQLYDLGKLLFPSTNPNDNKSGEVFMKAIIQLGMWDFNNKIFDRLAKFYNYGSHNFFRSLQTTQTTSQSRHNIHDTWVTIGQQISQNPKFKEKLVRQVGIQLGEGGITLADSNTSNYALRRLSGNETVEASKVNWRRSKVKDDHYYYNQASLMKVSKRALFFIDCDELVLANKEENRNDYSNLKKVFATMHILLQHRITLDCCFYFRGEEQRVTFKTLKDAYNFFTSPSNELSKFAEMINFGAAYREIERKVYPLGKKLVVPQQFNLTEKDFDSSTAVFTNQNLQMAELQGLPVGLMKSEKMNVFVI